MKLTHEVRDAIHEFVAFDHLEKKLIDSAPYQRLRNVHQLAMTYQVYPGATHKRFEHCIGVMDLAGRIFDSVFREDRLRDDVKERIGTFLTKETLGHWKKVVRVAALLHDLGHLPFSHAAEHLLPKGHSHETLTRELILHSEVAGILRSHEVRIDPQDVVDLAMDAKKRKPEEPPLSPWMTLLNEIITGNVFGADRIDYLLRDSHHAGVSYGRFDPSRLIDGLRVVVDPDKDAVALGLEQNCIHSAEALLLARYFMYTQVYFHDVRRAYDEHLTDYLKAWLQDGQFPTTWEGVLSVSDEEVLVAIRNDMAHSASSRHELARRLLARQHFRTVYELAAHDVEEDPGVLTKVFEAVKQAVGEDFCRHQTYGPKSEQNNFPVVPDSGTGLTSSTSVSAVLRSIPPLHIGLVFVPQDKVEVAKKAVAAVLDPLRQRAKKKQKRKSEAKKKPRTTKNTATKKKPVTNKKPRTKKKTQTKKRIPR